MAARPEDDVPKRRRASTEARTRSTRTRTDRAREVHADRDGHDEREEHDEPEERTAPRMTVGRAMRSAARQLADLLGRAPESVSAVKRTDDGWEADVEVLELERVPETTSVMATYRIALDGEGELVSYERIRRYSRGQIDRL